MLRIQSLSKSYRFWPIPQTILATRRVTISIHTPEFADQAGFD
ncbi:MAG: hypothetical protein WCI11_18755 [Candidatus Methylumidiphilus sp.]